MKAFVFSRSASAAFAAAVLAVPASAFAGKVRFGDSAEPGHAYNPVFSTDGKYIAFEGNNLGGNIDLYVSEVSGDIARDGAKVTLPLGRGGGRNPFGASKQVTANPTWHPDGVIFEGSNQGGDFRLYYYQPGGQAAWELIDATDIPGNLTFPDVSSDGSKMAFVASNTGNGDIYVRDNNAGVNKRVTHTESTESFPLFSADTNSIVFSRKKNDMEAIFEVNISSGAEKEIVSATGDQTRPVYAAGGKIVYFTSERGDGVWDIGVVTGGQRKMVAKDIRLPLRARPALDPKGEWLAYTSDDPTKADAVTLYKLDGSKTLTIPTPFKACGEPTLATAGGRLVLAYTALPDSGSDWRFLHVVDVTDKL